VKGGGKNERHTQKGGETELWICGEFSALSHTERDRERAVDLLEMHSSHTQKGRGKKNPQLERAVDLL